VAITRDERALAAQLAGALEAFDNEVRALPGITVRAYKADVAQLREAMGETSFAEELERGRALDPPAIVAAALAMNGARSPG
jgi:tRNA pseudouridine-54 N-methylase